MAISGSASYVWTTDEFLVHWESVNAALGVAGPLLVGEGVNLAALNALYQTLLDQRTQIQVDLNEREIRRSVINAQKQQLLGRLEQFRMRVLAVFQNQAQGQAFAHALPTLPGFGENEARFMDAFADASNLWTRIDASGTTIVLSGNYQLDSFVDAISDLRAEFRLLSKAVSDLKLARLQRNQTQDQIYPILKGYRQAVPSYFDAGSPFIESLPRLTPLPGATPDPVNASAVWDAAEVKARIQWEASAAPNLQKYQVRFTPGPNYDDDLEEVVANVAPDAPLELLTLAGLTQAGAEATFKVFVILTTGNEAGSVALRVTRPA